MKTIATLRAEEPDRPSVPQPDSVEKIVKQLALLAPDGPITYTGLRTVTFDKPVNMVILHASMFDVFRCTPGCSACCLKFTLDYLPREILQKRDWELRKGFKDRLIEINGRKRIIYTNDQTQNPICDFLTVPRGDGLGCAQFPLAPLSCASAPQFQVRQYDDGVTTILKRPFKSADTMSPMPQCEFFPTMEDKADPDDLALFDRFIQWADYLGIRTVLSMAKLALQSRSSGVVWER